MKRVYGILLLFFCFCAATVAQNLSEFNVVSFTEKPFVLLNTIQKIPYVQQTETQISLDQAIERQVWVKEYQNTSFSASVKKSRKEKENKDQ